MNKVKTVALIELIFELKGKNTKLFGPIKNFKNPFLRDVTVFSKIVIFRKKIMGVGGLVLGSLFVCIVFGLIIEIKERHLD